MVSLAGGNPVNSSVGRLTYAMSSSHTQTFAKLSVFVVALSLAACDGSPDLDVDLKTTSPPSFSFSGLSRASNFKILDVPRPQPPRPLSAINPFSHGGETIWQIASPLKLKAAEWPQVSYGVVPDGFSQSVPSSGSPPKLAEDKLYVASFSDVDANTEVWFEIRNGRAVNVSDKILGP
jgi:hypothetical protein